MGFPYRTCAHFTGKPSLDDTQVRNDPLLDIHRGPLCYATWVLGVPVDNFPFAFGEVNRARRKHPSTDSDLGVACHGTTSPSTLVNERGGNAAPMFREGKLSENEP